MINTGLIDPIVTERVRGGFLAVSPRKSPIVVGTIGDTEARAREAFAAVVMTWRSAREAELHRLANGAQ